MGKVQVLRQGLYYRFICHCRLSGDVVCKVVVCCGNARESLGILVPTGGGFGLETKMPVKRLGEGKPEFTVLPKQTASQGKFIPISPEEPFSYIEKLKNAYLVRQNGQLGICITEKTGTL